MPSSKFFTRCLNLATAPSGVTKGSSPSTDAVLLTDNEELDASGSLASLGICWTSRYYMNKQMDLAAGCKDVLEEADLPVHCEEQNTVSERGALPPSWFLMKSVVLKVWSPKCGPLTSGSSITWESVRNEKSWFPSQTY